MVVVTHLKLVQLLSIIQGTYLYHNYNLPITPNQANKALVSYYRLEISRTELAQAHDDCDNFFLVCILFKDLQNILQLTYLIIHNNIAKTIPWGAVNHVYPRAITLTNNTKEQKQIQVIAWSLVESYSN